MQRYYMDFSNHETENTKPIIGDFLIPNPRQLSNYIYWTCPFTKDLKSNPTWFDMLLQRYEIETPIPSKGPAWMKCPFVMYAFTLILHCYCKFTNHVNPMQCMLLVRITRILHHLSQHSKKSICTTFMYNWIWHVCIYNDTCTL